MSHQRGWRHQSVSVGAAVICTGSAIAATVFGIAHAQVAGSQTQADEFTMASQALARNILEVTPGDSEQYIETNLASATGEWEDHLSKVQSDLAYVLSNSSTGSVANVDQVAIEHLSDTGATVFVVASLRDIGVSDNLTDATDQGRGVRLRMDLVKSESGIQVAKVETVR